MCIKVTATRECHEIAFHCDICGKRVRDREAMFCYYADGETGRILEGHEIAQELSGKNWWITCKNFASDHTYCNERFEARYNRSSRRFLWNELYDLPLFLATNMDPPQQDLDYLAERFSGMGVNRREWIDHWGIAVIGFWQTPGITPAEQFAFSCLRTATIRFYTIFTIERDY